MNGKKRKQRKTKRKTIRRATVMMVTTVLLIIPQAALADGGDPIAVVNNFSDFMFALVRAFGMILIGFGIVQVGLSLKSHDPSQRANGIMTVAGGIIITFAKEILALITG